MTKIKNKIAIPVAATILALLAPLGVAKAQFRDFTWEDPIDRFGSIQEVVIAILNAIVTIAVPIVVLMIIYGGFQYVTARGNAEQLKSATRTLTYAIIGGLLIIGAVAITGIMGEAICEFRPAGTPGC